MRTLCLAMATLAAFAAAAGAADIDVSARVSSSKTSLNEPITLTVTVGGTVRSVPAPELPDLTTAFTIMSSGTSSSFNMVNGSVSSTKSWNYSLYPQAVGTFTIGPVSVEFGGAVYTTDPIEVEVVEGSAPDPTDRVETRRSTGASSGGRDVFIRTSVDKTSAYVDEQITLSFKLYSRINFWRQPQYIAPDVTGFWMENLPPQEEYHEDVDGYLYSVIEIKTALFGAVAGKATISPAELRYRERGRGFMFSSPGEERVLRTDPIEVEILPLPRGGRPDDYTGAVGEYVMSSSVDTRAVPELQPVTLTVSITGTGNMRTVPEPTLPELPDFKVYDSASSTDVSTEGRVVKGSKVFEYVFVPQSAGTRTIPSLSFSFFDPETGSYRTTRTKPIELAVSVGAGDDAGPYAQTPAGISRVASDIRYIREPKGALERRRGSVSENPLFALAQLLPALALVGVWMSRRRRDRLEGDAAYARFVKAPGRARKDLKSAAAALASGDHAGACAAVSKAVTDLAGGRLGIEARGMTLPELTRRLRAAGASEELTERVRRMLSECDLGRFAGSATSVEAERLVREASEVLTELERLSSKRGRR